jgi:SAM-dependent methyltransferase
MELVCPRCRAALRPADETLACTGCDQVYPVVRGVPVLINDDNSVFAIADYVEAAGYEGAGYGAVSDTRGGLRGLYRRMIRALRDVYVRPEHVTAEAAVAQVLAERPDARVLVIGAGDAGYDGDAGGQARFTFTDVAFSSKADYICDAHDLPFPDGSFDLALAVSVLEHVVDPARVVAEIHRVLADDGMAYAATPFLQPVHMGAHDFTRFTYLGQRRLFRCFDEIAGGMCLGPFAAAAKQNAERLRALTPAGPLRSLAGLVGALQHPFIAALDAVHRRSEAAIDIAAGVYFFGRKRATPIPDRELITFYRGGG